MGWCIVRGVSDERRTISPQVAILVLAVVIAAVAGAASIAGLLGSYALAWLLVNAAMVWGVEFPKARPWVSTAGVVLVLAAPTLMLARRVGALADAERLTGMDVHTSDRLWLETTPSIHPAFVTSDRPQLFFVHAPGAGSVRVAFDDLATVQAEALGHGLFRVELTPRGDTSRVRHRVREFEARLELDGIIHPRVMRRIDPWAHPRWLRPSPDRTRVCTTSEETDELVIVAGDRVERVSVLDGPTDCAWLSDDEIAVSHRFADALAFVRNGTVTATLRVGNGQSHLAISGAVLAVARPREIARVDRVTRAALPPVQGGAEWVTFAGETLVASSRAPARLRAGDRSVDLRAPVVTLAAVSGGRAVAAVVTDHASAGEPVAAHLGNHFIEDQIVIRDPTDLTVLRRIPTAGRSARQDAAGGLDRGTSPMQLDESPDGTLCVAFAGSDEVAWMPPRGETRWLDTAPYGLSAPHACVVLASGAVAITSPSSGAIAIVRPTGELLSLHQLAPTDEALRRDDPAAMRVREGERAFYEATRAGASCQSCHLHGASDEMVHNIGGLTLVPTLDVRGIAGTAPYLRDGSYPRISDLHGVAQVLYRGYREPANDRAGALEAWIAAQPHPWLPRERDPARERRGLGVFVRAGCPDCHSFPAFTNLGQHPAGAVFPRVRLAPGRSLDTPSLRGVGERARLLFDGRARSPREVITVHSREGRHGRVGALRTAEIDDLVTFLESL